MTEQTMTDALMDAAQRLIALDQFMSEQEVEHRLISVYGELTKLVGHDMATYLLTKAGIMGDRDHTWDDVDEAEAILTEARIGVIE